MKYILTEDAIIIPTLEETFQFSKENKFFNKILNIVKTSDSKEELNNFLFNHVNYEDNDISLIQERNSEQIEVFYNGKYFFLDKRLSKEAISLMELRDGFKSKYLANFLKNLFNSSIDYKYLLDKLFNCGFSFTSDGCVIIKKNFENEDEGFHYKLKAMKKSSELVIKTYVKVNPQNIKCKDDGETFYFDEYIVLGHSMWVKDFVIDGCDKLLNNNSYIGVPEKVIDIAYQVISKKISPWLDEIIKKNFGETDVLNKVFLVESLSRIIENE